MNPEDNDEIETMSDAEDDMGDVHQDAPISIIDLVIGGQASEAKDAIYASLYQKVGEKIDSLRPEIQNPNSTENQSVSDSTEQE